MEPGLSPRAQAPSLVVRVKRAADAAPLFELTVDNATPDAVLEAAALSRRRACGRVSSSRLTDAEAVEGVASPRDRSYVAGAPGKR